MVYDNITDVAGIKVGNRENMEALTGCTVVLTEDGAVCGVDVRGSAPGTRETDLLNPVNMVEKVHAVLLSGGSAFGLDAAGGVMQFLEEKGVGQDVGVAKVPIVPGAILFDLLVGDGKVRPDKEMGFLAAKKAARGKFDFGNAGAGCGATVGKITGFENAMKSGLGSASVTLSNGVTVGALVAVNAVGDVRDPQTGEMLAGPIDKEKNKMLDSLSYLEKASVPDGANTTIGVVAANVDLTKAQATKVAQVTHNALARTIFPVHTTMDGDTIFALATGGKTAPVDLIANTAAKVMEKAILEAVKSAASVRGIPSYGSLKNKGKM